MSHSFPFTTQVTWYHPPSFCVKGNWMVFPEWHFNRNLQIQFNKEIKGHCKDEAYSFFLFLKVRVAPLITHLHTHTQVFFLTIPGSLFPPSSTSVPRGFEARAGPKQVRCLFPVSAKRGSPSSASSLWSEISRPPIAELWSFFQAYAPRIYSNPSNSLKNGSVFKDKLAGTVTDRLWNLVVIHTRRKDHSFDFSLSFHWIVSQAVI